MEILAFVVMEVLFFWCLSLCCCRGRGLEAWGSVGPEGICCWFTAGPEGFGTETVWAKEVEGVGWEEAVEGVEPFSCRKASIMEDAVEDVGWYGCRLVKGLCPATSVWDFMSAYMMRTKERPSSTMTVTKEDKKLYSIQIRELYFQWQIKLNHHQVHTEHSSLVIADYFMNVFGVKKVELLGTITALHGIYHLIYTNINIHISSTLKLMALCDLKPN